MTAKKPGTMTPVRNLSKLVAEAKRLGETLGIMRALTVNQPVTIQIEVNNLQEVLDLLRYKLREETLRRAIHRLPDEAA